MGELTTSSSYAGRGGKGRTCPVQKAEANVRSN